MSRAADTLSSENTAMPSTEVVDTPLAEDAPLPETVGRYRLREQLAAGGFGVVHRGEDPALGRDVAIKILHAALAGNDTLVRRFEREVEVMRLVSHPSVVEVLEVGRLPDGRPYFVMELLQGVTLHDHLRARGRLPVDEVLEILAPLCDALEAAHQKSVIHRDVKPSNVFLSGREGSRRVVLLDFGVAKLLDADGPGLTASRHAVGTFACMAPEQLLCAAVDARTDVYALGVLAYRMLTGSPPFDHAPYLVMHHMHLHARPPRPSSRAPVSPAFDDVLLRALAKSPAERHPTAADFLRDLRLAAGRGRSAAGPQADGPLRRVLAVRFEARIAGEVGEDEGALFGELSSLVPVVTSWLSQAGLTVALEAGMTLLFTVDRPAAPDEDLALRLHVQRRVVELAARLAEATAHEPRIRVDFCVHVTTAQSEPEGSSVDDALLDFSSWVPETDAGGVLASRAALEGLSAETASSLTVGDVELVSLAAGAIIAPM